MASAVDYQDESPLDQQFTDLRDETVTTVVVNMTVESALNKGDWRALASALGFTGKQVQLIRQNSMQCKGRLLINIWEEIGVNSTLRRLIYALLKANMGECLREIAQDPDLEDVDFDSVKEEYALLKANKLYHKEFPRIDKDKFNNFLFPEVKMVPTSPYLPPESIMEVATKAESSLPGHEVNQTLYERSVFISFCPEASRLTKNHKFNNQLKKFAQFIQNQGFTLYFEPNCQDQIRSYGGVATWKEACIKKSKNILVICTPEYFKEDNKATSGSKVASEIEVDSRLLRQLVYGRESDRVIPVTLDVKKPTRSQVPVWLQPLVSFSWPSGEADLILCLEGQPRYVLPKVDPSKRKVIKPIVISCPRR